MYIYIYIYIIYIYRIFHTGGISGVPPTSQKFAHFPPPPFPPESPPPIPFAPKESIKPCKKNKNVIFSCSHCSCTIFVLIS